MSQTHRHNVRFCQISVLPLAVSVGIGWCLFMPNDHVESKFVVLERLRSDVLYSVSIVLHLSLQCEFSFKRLAHSQLTKPTPPTCGTPLLLQMERFHHINNEKWQKEKAAHPSTHPTPSTEVRVHSSDKCIEASTSPRISFVIMSLFHFFLPGTRVLFHLHRKTSGTQSIRHRWQDYSERE